MLYYRNLQQVAFILYFKFPIVVVPLTTGLFTSLQVTSDAAFHSPHSVQLQLRINPSSVTDESDSKWTVKLVGITWLTLISPEYSIPSIVTVSYPSSVLNTVEII